MIDDYEMEILDRTNILLISTDDRSYEELKKYGFKNVNQVKSISLLKKLLERKHKFERYNMVIIDSKMYELFKGESFLEKLRTIARENKIFRIILEIDRDLSHINLFSAHFKNNGGMSEYLMCGTSYQDIIERIVNEARKNGLIRNIVPKRPFTVTRFAMLPYDRKCPRTKIRLKILCLLPYEISDSENKVAENLAINVEFKHIKENELEKNVIDYLENYDMILVNENFNKKIVKLNKEVNELCKIARRKLATLISFEDIKESKEDVVNIEYSYAGTYAPFSYSIKETCKILNPKLKEDKEKYYETKLRCILDEAFFIYNDALIKTNNKPIRNFSVRKSGRTKKYTG